MGLRSRFIVFLVAASTLPNGAFCMGPFHDRTMAVELATLPTIAEARTGEPVRLIATVLAVGLGTFGAHRLYLGTGPRVPIIYGITFGGFGVMVLIDLGHILFTKDLETFRKNDQVFMWAGPKKVLTPP